MDPKELTVQLQSQKIRIHQLERALEVEKALERVRASTMAMHHSDDLAQAATVLFHQLFDMGIKPMACAFVILNAEDQTGEVWITSDGTLNSGSFTHPYHTDPVHERIFKAWRAGKTSLVEDLQGALLKDHLQFIAQNMPVQDLMEAAGNAAPERLVIHAVYYSHGFLGFNYEQPKEEHLDILVRFAKVFEQTYTRFLDLQKSEAQAREAQIEAALERVRAASMAMHRSKDLHQVINVLYSQLVDLGLTLHAAQIWDTLYDKHTLHVWNAGKDQIYPEQVHIPATRNVFFTRFYDAIKNDESFYTQILSKRQKDYLFKHYFKNAKNVDVPKSRQDFIYSSPGLALSVAIGKDAVISICRFDASPYPPAENEILKRFGKVFDQSYTRFLDLQKAEAQTREVQIEAALERVRAASMAMRKSKDLHQVINELYNQLADLGLNMHSAQIWDTLDDKQTLHVWTAGRDLVYPEQVHIPITKNVFFTRFSNAVNNDESFYTQVISKREKNELFKHYFKNSKNVNVPKERQDFVYSSPGVAISAAKGKDALISICRFDAIPYLPADNEILKRFGKVFDQTYTRFLDLQKAEAQTREAQIEAALERVRSTSMAMHDSKDLHKVIVAVYNQLEALGLKLNSASIAVSIHDKKTHHHWTAANGQIYPKLIYIPYNKNILFTRMRSAIENQESFYTQSITKKQKDNFFSHYFRNSNHKDVPKTRQNYIFSTPGIELSAVPGKHTVLSVMRYDGIPYRKDENEIIKRIAQVFEQAYTRFLDLQKAEVQAREAQIEATLERVRAKAMAMHSSSDLLDTTAVLIHELNSLNIHPARLGIAEIIPERQAGKIFTTQVGGQQQNLKLMADITLKGNEIFEEIFDYWKNEKEYFPILKGKVMTNYYRELNKYVEVKHPPKGSVQYGLFMFYEKVGIYAWAEQPYEEEVLNVFRKYLAVLGLTYQRYKDLQDAENRAKEAQREASLHRVRAVIASMRTAEDLQKITPLIWQELTTLEVPFFRCGVFIINESTEHVQAFLTTSSGDSLAALDLPFGTSDLVDRTINHWRDRKILRQEWTREQFVEWTQSIVDRGFLKDSTTYQGGEAPPEHLALHFVPFTQGMLYVGSKEILEQSQLDMVQSLAEAFAVAYARYEDFNKLESANTALEKTLDNLKSTQNQLIQSEKMASLGELTAGIAHEIQNPLNFVNNFSEVNEELIAELKDELKNGNVAEAINIAEDLFQNEGKIKQHGRRADAIVKSMLQHSRTSSGEKELTDINALCDEYLRLAYHGMRARDKSFNAELKTELDPELPKIEVVPQDIGRVLLNLINNAFQATSAEALAQKDNGYIPMVIVSTKKLENKVEIRLSDNGPGIPAEIKDKIFQPFYTTKPAGQGTGLGLSLSYDIMKAHGGDIQVQSEKGKGSAFIIELQII